MKRILYPAIVVFIIWGCKSKPKEAKLPVTDSIAVTVTNVRSEQMETNLRYSGTVEPSQTVPLTFQTSGIVEKVMVDAGDEVKKGQLLASVDKADPQSIYNMNLAKFNQAKDAYDRLKMVYDKGSLPEVKWVEMETNLQQAKSSLEVSKNNLEKCDLRAPEAGVIGKRNVEPGMSSMIVSSAPLELVQIKTVYIKISVPENEIGKIRKGDKATFAVSALNGKTFEGTVINISPVADAISRTYATKITVQNSQMELKPGMVCDVMLNTKSQKDLVLVPYQSVTSDSDGKNYVFLVNKPGKTAHKLAVQTGSYQGNDIEIIAGIAPGQTIVKEGKEKLSDNSLIRF